MDLYWKILRFGANYQRRLPLALVCLLGYNLFSVFSLSLIIPFLEILFSNEATKTSLSADADIKTRFLYALTAQTQSLGKETVLLYFCLTVLVAVLIKNAFRYAGAYTLAPLEFSVLENLRNAVFEKLTRLSLAYYGRNRKGPLLNLVTVDVEIIQQAVVGTVTPLISDPFTMLFFFITMLALSWRLTLFTLVVLPLTGFVISRIARSLKRKAQRGQNRLDRLMAVVDEFIGGARVVKAFTAEETEKKKFIGINKEYATAMIAFRRRTELASPLTEILTVAVVLGVLYYGAALIIRGLGTLHPSEFIGFIILFSQFIAPIKTFSSAVSRIQKANVSYKRIENLLVESVAATENEREGPTPVFSKSICLRDVSFQYEDKMVLKNINIVINKGETVAFVGPSGGGKSTLLDLLCRFYDPTQGQILLDGVDLRDFDSRAYRKLLGIVTQESIIFHDTVAHNIGFGDETIDLAAVNAAAETANAAAFIEVLPYGYDTLLGERGSRLSGGQRQRIAIARAVYRNPAILILDEATSALDSEAERTVQQAIDRVASGRTCLVVAHRLSTIVNADRIYVLSEGEVIEAGTHQELIRISNGLYKRLYEIQYAENN